MTFCVQLDVRDRSPTSDQAHGLHPPKSRPIDGNVILSPDSFPRIPSARSPPTPRDCGLRSPSSRPYPASPEKTLSLPPPAPLPSPILRSGSAAADQATLVAVGSGALPPLHRHVKGASSSSLSDPLENPRILWTPSNKELPRHLHATRSLSCRCSPYHTSSPDWKIMNFACLIKFAFMDCREAYHPHCVGEEDRLRSSEDWFGGSTFGGGCGDPTANFFSDGGGVGQRGVAAE
uniref:Uncharacterized protein n=1 Tax=Oryza glumipatula TaxID=40148 RepID=A0A0D9Z9S2_9ORYZ